MDCSILSASKWAALRATFEATDLSLLDRATCQRFSFCGGARHLKLIVECPPLPEPVYVDREMWEKIVLNLLSNALKSTFEGEIRVGITAPAARHSSVCRIRAPASRKATCRTCSSAFRRIEGARRRSHEGSGIGLALVQRAGGDAWRFAIAGGECAGPRNDLHRCASTGATTPAAESACLRGLQSPWRAGFGDGLCAGSDWGGCPGRINSRSSTAR
jgi:hypothetical protein